MATKKAKISPVFTKLLFAAEYLNYLSAGTWLAVAAIIWLLDANGTFSALTTFVAHATLGFVCRWIRQQ